jgi:hypothetical protein
MITVLMDNDITGFRDLLAGSFRATGWHTYLTVDFVTLSQAGLAPHSIDREVWRFCQRNGFILLTGNRNNDGVDSLAQTLLDENREDSLPVITISDKDRLHETEYREICIHSLAGILIELDNYLGRARQYIP